MGGKCTQSVIGKQTNSCCPVPVGAENQPRGGGVIEPNKEKVIAFKYFGQLATVCNGN